MTWRIRQMRRECHTSLPRRWQLPRHRTLCFAVEISHRFCFRRSQGLRMLIIIFGENGESTSQLAQSCGRLENSLLSWCWVSWGLWRRVCYCCRLWVEGKNSEPTLHSQVRRDLRTVPWSYLDLTCVRNGRCRTLV